MNTQKQRQRGAFVDRMRAIETQKRQISSRIASSEDTVIDLLGGPKSELAKTVFERMSAAKDDREQLHVAIDECDLGAAESSVRTHVVGMQKDVDTLHALDSEWQALAKKIGTYGGGILNPAGGPALADGADGFGDFRLAFGAADMRVAWNAIRQRQAATLGVIGDGMFASTDSSAVPQAGVPQYLLRDLFPVLRERPFLFETFPSEAADATNVVVYKGTGAADGAAFVSPGATKPTSTPTWAAVTIICQVVAHLARVDNAVTQDFSAWEDVIGREMIAGLLATIDAGILSGDGSSPNLQGILTDNSISTVTRDTTNESRIDAVHRALTAVRNVYFADPTTIVIHPSDLLALQTEKASTAGLYLAGSPTDPQLRSLWGLDVIPSTSIDEGTALVFNPAGGRIFWRQGPGIEINPWHSDAWERNQLSLRCEAKLGFAVVRPEAFCKVIDL